MTLDCTPDRALERLANLCEAKWQVERIENLPYLTPQMYQEAQERREALDAEFRQAQAYLDEVRWGDGNQTGNEVGK